MERAGKEDQVYRVDTYYQAGCGWWATVEGYYARRWTYGPFATLHGALNAAMEVIADRTTPTKYVGDTADGHSCVAPVRDYS